MHIFVPTRHFLWVNLASFKSSACLFFPKEIFAKIIYHRCNCHSLIVVLTLYCADNARSNHLSILHKLGQCFCYNTFTVHFKFYCSHLSSFNYLLFYTKPSQVHLAAIPISHWSYQIQPVVYFVALLDAWARPRSPPSRGTRRAASGRWHAGPPYLKTEWEHPQKIFPKSV